MYDESKLSFSSRPTAKLQIQSPDGRVHHFGRAGYGDFLIYKQLEAQGKVPQGTARQKQRVFQASHSRIRGNWQQNPFSPNALALAINW